MIQKPGGRREHCTLTFPACRPWYFELKSDHYPRMRVQDEDMFECLVQLHQELEEDGWYILCADSRIDIYLYARRALTR